MRLKGIPRNVVVLGLVSFLTDVSSDMIYPLLPVFLTQSLGAGQGFLGLIEGIAESTAAFFTLVSGLKADRVKDRSGLVLAGYSLSSFARPLIAMAWTPWVVLWVRFFDRMGKGIRTSPRDALIADSVEPHYRGKAFGLHRSMDHAGAVTGPILASVLLATCVKDLRHLFWLAAVPGVLSVALIAFKVREVLPKDRTFVPKPIALSPPRGRLRVYLAILFVFLLSCSTDAFLLLRAAELGVPAPLLPLIWMLMNVVKMATTMPLGAWSDRVGRRKVILFGWTVYALVYVGFAFASKAEQAWALFAVYGLFYGFTEGTERAILADHTDVGERGHAYGWYYFVVGMASLPASLIFGWLWQAAGSKTAFLTSAAISILAAVMMAVFLVLAPSRKKIQGDRA